MPTLADMLAVSAALGEKIASAPEGDPAREALARRQALVDFAAFGLFKEAQGGNFLPALQRGLGWGAGIGLPLLGGGLLLEHGAKADAEKVIDHARNQALLAALGVGGVQALGRGMQSAFEPTRQERLTTETTPDGAPRSAYEVTKVSADAALRGLAATLLLDDVLVADLAREKSAAVEECLLMNRQRGVGLLRELLR